MGKKKIMVHSSKIKGLCLMKWPSETLQNLPYTKSQVVFFSIIFTNEYPGLCQHRPGHSLGVFIFQKYGKIWSVSLGHFIKHIPLISEECLAEYYCIYITRTFRVWRKRQFWTGKDLVIT